MGTARHAGPHDKSHHGSAVAFAFQSEFQRKQLEPRLAPLGYDKATGHLIRGAFDFDEWEPHPRPHGKHEPFGVGCVARPNADKWSTNTQRIYDRIAYRHHMTAWERYRQGYNPNWETG